MAIGLDLGYDTVKVIGLTKKGRLWRLVGLATATVPTDSWSQETLKNGPEIAKILTATLRGAKPAALTERKLTVALPESAVLTTNLTVPRMPPEQLAQTVPFEVAQKLSISPDEFTVDYETTDSVCKPLDEKGGQPTIAQVMIFAVAAKKTLIQSLVEICGQAHLELAGVDIKPGAIVRSVVPSDDRGPRLVIDLGANSTICTVAEGQKLRVLSSVALGTHSTQTTRDDLVGFQTKAEPIFDEVVHLTKFYENRVCPGAKIQQIILTGGGSNIRGVDELFSRETGLTTVIGNPFKLIDSHHFPIPAELNHTFADAIGLAIR
ncbi:MAG: pilus assembly protein PilM [Patescibacteria group bacterium]